MSFLSDKGEKTEILFQIVNSDQSKLLDVSKCAMGMTEKEYRQTLSGLRRHIGIIENNLLLKDYAFQHEKVPGKALFQYRKPPPKQP